MPTGFKKSIINAPLPLIFDNIRGTYYTVYNTPVLFMKLLIAFHVAKMLQMCNYYTYTPSMTIFYIRLTPQNLLPTPANDIHNTSAT